MTPQEAFDKAARGLKSQGFRRSADGMGCLYNGPEGRHCAVGWLLVGLGELRWGDNRQSIDRLSQCNPSAWAQISDLGRTFLWQLQDAHDLATTTENDLQDDPAKMEQNLRSFAQVWGLSDRVLDEAL